MSGVTALVLSGVERSIEDEFSNSFASEDGEVVCVCKSILLKVEARVAEQLNLGVVNLEIGQELAVLIISDRVD